MTLAVDWAVKPQLKALCFAKVDKALSLLLDWTQFFLSVQRMGSKISDAQKKKKVR